MDLPRKSFHIGDILSVLSGLVVSPRGRPGVDAVLDFMAGRRLTGMERLAYSSACRCAIEAQHPDLPMYSDEDAPSDEFMGEWLARRALELGESREISALSPDQRPLLRAPEL